MVVLEHAIEDEDSVMSCAAIWEWTGWVGVDQTWIGCGSNGGSGVDQVCGSGMDQTRRAWIGRG